MTYEEFLADLSGTRGWYLCNEGGNHDAIRLISRPDVCPGLECKIFSDTTADYKWKVARAADNTSDHDPKIRKDLLAACGLEEA